jgi:hypothetical protein
MFWRPNRCFQIPSAPDVPLRESVAGALRACLEVDIVEQLN